MDFGIKRELKVVRIAGDQEALLIEFNQPIQALDDSSPVPFLPRFEPQIPIAQIARVGNAAVRVDFAMELPKAHSYRVTIPRAWRALTGAALVRDSSHQWHTQRPLLKSVSQNDKAGATDPSQGIVLHFDQSVSLDSVRSCLLIKERETNRMVEASLAAGPSPATLTLTLTTPVSAESSLELTMKPGLQSLAGPLPGLGGESFVVGAAPTFSFLAAKGQSTQDGSFHLLFSQAVDEDEIRRNIQGVPWENLQILSKDKRSFTLKSDSLNHLTDPRVITLSPELRSSEGARLDSEGVKIILRSQEGLGAGPEREMERLLPGHTLLPYPAAKASTVITWQLTANDALEMMRTAPQAWQSQSELGPEKAAPKYLKKLDKASGATRFLADKEYGKRGQNQGLFLVRVTNSKGAVKRHLVSRSEQVLDSWWVNETIFVQVRESQSKKVLADIPVELRGAKGERLARGTTKADAPLQFSVAPGTSPAAVVCLLAKDEKAVQALRRVRVSEPRLMPGLLWSERTLYKPSEQVSFTGLWWAKGLLGDMTLTDSRGQSVVLDWKKNHSAGNFFQGEFTAPKDAGLYHLNFAASSYPGPELTFLVSNLEQDIEESSSLDLAKPDEGEAWKGQYSWSGTGRSKLGLRARLLPRVTQTEGWRRLEPGAPNWIDVPLSAETTPQGASFQLETLPAHTGPQTLLVELYEVTHPSVILSSSSQQVGEPELHLSSVEMRHRSESGRSAKFRFLFPNDAKNRKRVLKCQLSQDSIQSTDQSWRVLSEGQAEWREGAYEWNTSLPEHGTFRLLCEYQQQAESKTVLWEHRVPSSKVADLEPLTVSAPEADGALSLDLTWPGLSAGTPIWLSVCSGDGQVSSTLRLAEKNGSIGSVNLTELGMGSDSVVLLAGSSGPDQSIRGSRVPLSAFPRIAESKREGETERELKTDDFIDLPWAEWAQGDSLVNGIFWWMKMPERGSELEFSSGLPEDSLRARNSAYHLESLQVQGPVSFSDKQSFTISTPSLAGDYKLCFLSQAADGQLSLRQQMVGVKRADRWQAVGPLVLRAGDEFSAGVRFWSSSDSLAKTGVTISALPRSTLLPLSYLTTVALVSPGGQDDVLFNYRAPDFSTLAPGEGYLLAWELGVEGVPALAEMSLKALRAPSKERKVRETVLENGLALNLNLAHYDYWKLRLSLNPASSSKIADSSAVIGVAGLAKGDINVKLSGEESSREFFGIAEDSILSLKQLKGKSVKMEFFRLEPVNSEQTRQAKGLYITRRVEDESGSSVQKDLTAGSKLMLSHRLILPQAKRDLRLEAPLPGGFEATGCWLVQDGSLTAVDWTRTEEGVEVQIPPLDAGERQVLLGVRALVPGTYSWPACRILNKAGEVEAQLAPELVRIDRS